jgi:beta-lactam-binding protein with PASTA domain
VPASSQQTVVPPMVVPPTGAAYLASGPPPRKRSSRFLWILLGLLVLLAAGLVFLATRLDRGSTAQKAVPSVVGQQVDRATQVLENDGFKVTANQVANTDHPTGQVFAQNPIGGQMADVGSTVTLTVSKGTGQKEVPNVIGMTQAAAQNALQTASFVPRVNTQNSDTVPAGQVISQSPQGGSKADPGSEVDITVSSGPATVQVPNVAGQTEATAAANLAAAGFVVSTVHQSSTTVPAGIVIGTNPAGGLSVAPKSPVTIIVSTGPPPTSTTSSSTTTSLATTSTT